MKFFKKKSVPKAVPELITAQRNSQCRMNLPSAIEPFEKELYDRLRNAVPIIDAALMKIIRLTGGFRVICSDGRYQLQLDDFLENIPVGLTGISLDSSGERIAGLWNGDVAAVRVTSGENPFIRQYAVKNDDNTIKTVTHPERILYASLTGGRPLLRGIPALSSILMRIYECIGQNFDRVGNVRYAVTYKPPSDSGDFAYSRERAMQIAKEWADGMNSAKYGQVKDFVAVGDVDIKVIGAENQLFDTNVPVRQLMEQIIAKLSIPPFLLGLSWNTTERMSSQQADILTSELEYYRRLLTPVICEIGNSFICSIGADAVCSVEWDNINLQDESALAEARLKNAQAREIEMRLENLN